MLHFDAKDQRIRHALRNRSYHATSLAVHTALSRTTVAYRLRRLAEAGIVEEVRGKGRARMWRLSQASRQGRSEVHTYRGDDILRALTLLKQSPKNSTIFACEGSQWLQLTLKSVSPTFAADLQRAYRKRHITFKSLIHQRYLKVAEEIDTSLLLEHRKRSFALFAATNGFLNECAFFFTRKHILLFNEAKQLAVVISDKAMVQMIYEAMSVFFGVLEYAENINTINLNKHMEDMIAERFSPGTRERKV